VSTLHNNPVSYYGRADGGDCSVSPYGEPRDVIVVRDGLDPASGGLPVLARYCGALDDVTVTSSGDAAVVQFDSDGRHERPGFAGDYEFTAAARRRQPETATPANVGQPRQQHRTKPPNDAAGNLARLTKQLVRRMRLLRSTRC